MSKIEYNGRPEFQRPRNLTEETASGPFIEQLANLNTNTVDERQEAVEKIFTDLAKTYLKGEKLLNGIRQMEPAQFITIEEDADNVAASAKRFDTEQSRNGTVITYSMYTKAVDAILKHQWTSRISYTSVNVPASVTSQKAHIDKIKSKGGGGGLLSSFLADNGVSSIIIGMLTLSPFQNIIFQTLTVEEGAKGIQTAQIVPGIALLLEIGIKADRLLKMMKSAKIDNAMVEQQVNRLSSSNEARAEALDSIGINVKDLKAATEVDDGTIIMDYVSDHYRRYGGLVSPGSHLTIDHWISYSHVARNQQTIKGALNTAESFSSKFNDIRSEFSEQSGDFVSGASTNKRTTSKMVIQLASATRALRERSDDLYDDIIDSLQYQLTDRDLCCLVQIFGANYDTDLMKTIASILRILAVDLGGELVRIDNYIRKLLSGIFQDALFEVASQFNELYHKILEKITKLFTIKIDGAEACGGLLSIGWALLQSIRVLFSQLQALIAELSALIGDYGQSKEGSWTVSADRRHLLGIARVLEVLAARLELAKSCDKPNSSGTMSPNSIENADSDGSAVLAIIEKSDPILNLEPKDVQRYFSNRKPRTSEKLKFQFGIKNVQNTSSDKDPTKCSDGSKQSIENLIQVFKDALSNIDE